MPALRIASSIVTIILMLATAGTAPAGETVAGPLPQSVDDDWVPYPDDIRVETWVSGLTAPWALAFLPDGRALVTERSGTIRLIEQNGQTRILTRVKVHEDDESGLMGLAVHPKFSERPFVYAMYTRREGGRIENRVVRFRFRRNSLTDARDIVTGIPAGDNHNGGRIAFGPDGMLYIGTGDIFRRDLAQSYDSLAGKILRVNPEGRAPGDNPYPGSPIWSVGHRNVQGLAWHPQTGVLYATEHGPSGEVGFSAYDEINVITQGGNYGWPRVVGAPDVEGYTDPLIAWAEISTPPSGAAFWHGDLFVATLGSEALVRIRMNGGRVTGIERWFADKRWFDEDIRSRSGRLRDAVRGPDGALYVLTGNHDWRGDRRLDSDRILRITLDD